MLQYYTQQVINTCDNKRNNYVIIILIIGNQCMYLEIMGYSAQPTPNPKNLWVPINHSQTHTKLLLTDCVGRGEEQKNSEVGRREKLRRKERECAGRCEEQ